MALIYTKLTDKTVVLAPRQGICRKLNFGDDWTEMRIGMFASSVADTGSNDNNVNELLVPATDTDYLTFGLKNDSTTALPGQTGSLFLGVRSHDATLVQSQGPASGFVDSGGMWDATGYFDTTRVFNATPTGNNGPMGGGTASGATGYCGFMAIRIVIIDRGLSSQNVTIQTAFVNPVTGSNYTKTALRTAINNASYAVGRNIAWNDGAAARAIPDCVWVRCPLYDNALRISAIRAVRYAP